MFHATFSTNGSPVHGASLLTDGSFTARDKQRKPAGKNSGWANVLEQAMEPKATTSDHETPAGQDPEGTAPPAPMPDALPVVGQGASIFLRVPLCPGKESGEADADA